MDEKEVTETKEGHEAISSENQGSEEEMIVETKSDRRDDSSLNDESEHNEERSSDEALDLSFASPSIPLKKRRLMSSQAVNDSSDTPNEETSSSEGNSLRSSHRKDDSSKRISTQGKDSSASAVALCSKGMGCGRPGYITCSICNATKYYSHVQRRFGQFSCEPCSKFMKRFLKEPKVFTCAQTGYCQIGKPAGEQEPRGVSVNRCKACWLKICLEKFILEPKIRTAIDKFYSPKFNFEKMGASKEKSSVSQNHPPPLPLPARKRKTKSESISYPFANESLRSTKSKNRNPVDKTPETRVNNSTSTASQNNVSPKKPLTVRRESSSAENQSKDLDLDEGAFEAYEECGKCTYCLHSNQAKANVVVVKETCKYKKCILSGLLSNDKEEIVALSPTSNLRKVVKVSKSMKSDAQLDTDSPVNLLSNNIYNNKRNNRAFFRREMNDSAFSSETSFLNEILNANSPFINFIN